MHASRQAPERAGAQLEAAAQRSSRPPAAEGCTEAERLGRTRAAQLAEVVAAGAERRREDVFHRLRTLCEDLDELLGQTAEAARVGVAEAAAEPLATVRLIATQVLRALRRSEPHASGACHRDGPLDEDEVLAAIALVEELDAQLRDAHIGYRGAGWRAAEIAERLLAAVIQLIAAASSGRTRARISGAAEATV